MACRREDFAISSGKDPQAFLASVDIPEATLREEIVGALLQEADSGATFDDFEIDYPGLQHPDLAAQLRPALQASQGNLCRIAVRIARDCSVVESVPDLTGLALNERADPPLRASAAMAVYDLSTEPSHDLVVIIGSTTGRGPDEHARELEAAALIASWPHAVSTETVFSVLSPSNPRNHYGLYSVFIDQFAQGLSEPDLEHAVQLDAGRHSRLTTVV